MPVQMHEYAKPPNSILPLPTTDGAIEPIQPTRASRVNFRTLALASLGFVVLAVSVHFLHGYQIQRLATGLLDRAEVARSSGELEEAAQLITEYLALRPADSEQIYELALIRLASATTPQEKLGAYLICEGILRREPDRHELRQQILDMLIQAGGYREALVHIQALLARNPDDVELNRLSGQCHEAIGEYETAEVAYRNAIRGLPNDLDVPIRLANILEKELRRPSQADAVMDEMVSRNGHSFQVYLARARYLRERKLGKDAALDVQTAFQMAPSEPDVLIAASELVADQWGRSEGGVRVDLRDLQSRLEEQLTLNPGHTGLIQALTQIETLRGRADVATSRLVARSTRTPRALSCGPCSRIC